MPLRTVAQNKAYEHIQPSTNSIVDFIVSIDMILKKNPKDIYTLHYMKIELETTHFITVNTTAK